MLRAHLLGLFLVAATPAAGLTMATVARAAFTNVQELSVPDSGHWLMEEQPAATVAAVRAFLDKPI